MKKKLRCALLIFLAVLFVYSGARVIRQFADYRAAEKIYNEAEDIALRQEIGEAGDKEGVKIPGLKAEETKIPLAEDPLGTESEKAEDRQEPLEEKALFLLDTDIASLRVTNKDVLGWISIPGVINYPLMEGADNSEYLYRAWDGSSNSAGSIFLECKNNRNFEDFNTIIYGHRMKNGSMFGTLYKYADEAYLKEHPHIYIVTDDAVLRYKIFAAYEAQVTGDTYRLYFEDDVRRESVLDYYLEHSVIESDVVPKAQDRILTLSTCIGNGTYDTRWVVQAVLTGEFSV